MSLRTLETSIGEAISHLFEGIETEVKEVFLPAAIAIVNAMKDVTVLDSTDIIGSLAGAGGKAVEDEARAALPTILIDLRLVAAADIETDLNAAAKAGLTLLGVSSGSSKAATLISAGALLLSTLSKGKVTIGQAAQVTQAFYKNPAIVK